ncbi:hypothetical protein R8Z50_23405 [Longispora sp. K20-0274]|uniref:CBM96 family carbohydrate-binding protein n=1 Tax=Longispora sp. K20-0274 TaxID=3088255 RepID=UPI00399B4B28
MTRATTALELRSVLSTGSAGAAKDWIPLDVTAHVKTRYAGDRIATIGLAQGAGGNAVILSSRTAGSTQPFLEVITD